MSIKQNGGVFSRNPTFNDVTIEGDLIINGEVFTGLDFQGSWDASTNTPTIVSSTGTKGEFYIVSVAGTTNIDGITNWGVGDWALFNGSVWQRVEGGADGNFVDLSVSGTSALTGSVGIGATVLTTSLTMGTGSTGLSFQSGNLGNNSGKIAIIKPEEGGSGYGSLVFETYQGGSGGGERLRISPSGDVIINTGNLVVSTAGTPASATAAGVTGTIEWDASYIYVCTATNTWKRTAIATW